MRRKLQEALALQDMPATANMKLNAGALPGGAPPSPPPITHPSLSDPPAWGTWAKPLPHSVPDLLNKYPSTRQASATAADLVQTPEGTVPCGPSSGGPGAPAELVGLREVGPGCQRRGSGVGLQAPCWALALPQAPRPAASGRPVPT